MKGKVIYVDFSSNAKKVTYAEAPNNKGFWTRFLIFIKKMFRFPEKQHKHRQDTYDYKRMM